MSPSTGAEVMAQFIPQSPLVAKLGIVAEALDAPEVRLRMPWDPTNTTLADMVHGGAIAALAETTASMGVFAYARAAGAPADAGQPFAFAVRAFVGNGRRFEDAASGAANAVLAAWLDQRDALPGGTRAYTVSQGREIGFDARLDLRLDAAGDVWSGGEVRTVVRGTLDW